MILIAGGSGITSCLPWLQYISQTMKDDREVRTTQVKLLWVMREAASLGWVPHELAELSHSTAQGKLTMEFFRHGSRPAKGKAAVETWFGRNRRR